MLFSEQNGTEWMNELHKIEHAYKPIIQPLLIRFVLVYFTLISTLASKPSITSNVNNCLVQLRYQIWPQKTTEGSPDCWANHWYNPPYSPRTVLIQSEQKGLQNHSGPLTSSTLPLWTVAVWSTLQSSKHQNGQTQKQFLPPSNPSHEHLTLNVEHTTLLYIIYSSHILIYISNLHISYLYIHNCLYYILCFCFFCTLPILYICILFFLLSVSCPVAVFPLHCGASVTITNSSRV